MASQTHLNEVTTTLLKYIEDGFLCDTILTTIDGELRAHSAVLAAGSPLFKAVFSENTRPGMRYINLPGFDATVVEVALRFIYTGKLLLPAAYTQTSELPKLFAALHHLGLEPQKLNGCEMRFKSPADASLARNKADVPHCDVVGTCSDNQEITTTFAINTDTNTSGSSDTDDKTNSDEMETVKETESLKTGKSTTKLIQPPSRHSTHITRKSQAFQCKRPAGADKKSKKDGTAKLLRSTLKVQTAKRPLNCGQKTKKLMDLAAQPSLDEVKESTKKEVCFVVVPSNKVAGIVESVGALRQLVTAPTKRALQTIRHKCPTCGKLCTNRSRLRQHLFIHTGERPYPCDICDHRFTNKSNLDRHRKMHTGFKTHLCDLCGKGFIQKTSLEDHMVIHAAAKTYDCELCGRAYNRKNNLRQHVVRVHERPALTEHTNDGQTAVRQQFLCDLCGKGFASVVTLRLHTMLHSGNRPFACGLCGKAFVQKALLVQHTRVHSGEKTYVCPTCDKAFVYKDCLTQHARIHTGERPYECNVCGNRYTQSHHLKGHMLTHTGERPYVCSTCDKAYKNRADLRFHCTRVHGFSITVRRPNDVVTSSS